MSDHFEDIVQLATMKVLRILREGEGNRVLAASYLKRVAYTVAIDELRRRKMDREIPMDADLERRAVDVAPGPDRAADASVTQRALAACMARLNEARRIAVTAYLQGHTVPETARLSGWSGKRTENLVYRGLQQLRECLRAKGVTP